MSSVIRPEQAATYQASENKNAIFFAISDGYCFAAANVITGLYKHSEDVVKSLDIIIFHNGISEKNKELLQKLHKATYFIPMQFPKQWEELLSHPKTKRWGEYIVCKFFGFGLIEKYERVLHLDADMHIRGDIAELFSLEEELAWRSIVAWNPTEVFSSVLSEGEKIKCGNGGLLLFSNKLVKYNIDAEAIKKTFLEVNELEIGGIDETVFALLAHKNGIKIKELDISIYNTPSKLVTEEARIIHFLDANAVSSKPWLNLASFLYYDDWAENYRKWLDMGGEGLVNFSKEDYYKLFSYDKAEKLQELNKRIRKINRENESLQKEISELKEKNSKLRRKIKKKNNRISKLEVQLEEIYSSKFWKITKPLRLIMRLFGGRKDSY